MSTNNDSKVALVTGANRGIGKAIVKGLAREGFVVLLGARDAVKGSAAAAELQTNGCVQFLQLDVTEEASVRAAAEKVSNEFGRLDVLVNNAGVNGGGRPGPPVEETPELLRMVYETNVFAVVRMTNAFLPLLRRSPAGRIVNVTSKRGSIGEEGGWVGQPSMAYSSSKTALNAITVHYARYLKDTPIKVNGAAPGHVSTGFNGFRGVRTPEEGAVEVIRLARLPADGPTGAVFEDARQLLW